MAWATQIPLGLLGVRPPSIGLTCPPPHSRVRTAGSGIAWLRRTWGRAAVGPPVPKLRRLASHAIHMEQRQAIEEQFVNETRQDVPVAIHDRLVDELQAKGGAPDAVSEIPKPAFVE